MLLEDEYEALCGALELLASGWERQSAALESLRLVSHPPTRWPSGAGRGSPLSDVTQALDGPARHALDDLESALALLGEADAPGVDGWTSSALMSDPRWDAVRHAARACLVALRQSLA